MLKSRVILDKILNYNVRLCRHAGRNLCPDAADLSVLPETNIKVDIHLKVKES